MIRCGDTLLRGPRWQDSGAYSSIESFASACHAPSGRINADSLSFSGTTQSYDLSYMMGEADLRLALDIVEGLSFVPHTLGDFVNVQQNKIVPPALLGPQRSPRGQPGAGLLGGTGTPVQRRKLQVNAVSYDLRSHPMAPMFSGILPHFTDEALDFKALMYGPLDWPPAVVCSTGNFSRPPHWPPGLPRGPLQEISTHC